MKKLLTSLTIGLIIAAVVATVVTGAIWLILYHLWVFSGIVFLVAFFTAVSVVREERVLVKGSKETK